jgi:hypothetical protein
MKLTLSASSTLLFFARYGGLQPGIAWSSRDKCFERTDLCSLFWCTLWGLLRAPFWVCLFGAAGAFVVGLMVGYPFIAILAWLMEGLAFEEGATFVLAWWSVFIPSMVVLWAHVTGRLNRPTYAVRDTASTAADFIRAGYRSWKDKTCILVDLKEV